MIVRIPHPRREAIGEALARAYPIVEDKEAREEKHLARRIDIAKAVK